MTQFIPMQGQYLAFIRMYTATSRRPPSEVDMQRFFGVTAPSLHQMVLTLETRGLIERVPGMPRSMRVVVRVESLPTLQERQAGAWAGGREVAGHRRRLSNSDLSEAASWGDPDHGLASGGSDSIEVVVVVPDGCAGQLGDRRNDQVRHGDAMMQRSRVGEKTLDLEGTHQGWGVAIKLTKRIEFLADRVVVARALSTEQHFESDRTGGRYQVVVENATPLGRNFAVTAAVPGAGVG